MRYDFTTLADRAATSAFKTSGSKIKEDLGLNYFDDTIPMWIADMDFVVAPPIVEAIKVRADRATFGYSGFSDEYYQSLLKWFASRHSMHFEREHVVYSAGTVPAIRDVVRAFTREGEGVIIQPPVYYPFSRIVEENGRQLIENHLIVDADSGYMVDFDDFETKCADPSTKLFIYCNPHNPIGQVWCESTTRRLIEICQANDVIFFSDEVHADILRQGVEFCSALNLCNGVSRGLIVATAVNKTFNLAGLHITNLIVVDDSLRERLNGYMGHPLISPFAHEAAIAAYRDCGEWVDQMLSTLDDNLDYMEQFIALNLPKVRFNKPQATYLAWLDFRAYGICEAELLRLCADKGHLILEGGSMFGVAGEGFVRVNVACPKATLVEALDRLKRLFGEI